MPDAPVDLEAVQKWRRTTFEQANQLCARAAIIVDFFIACLKFYEHTAPDRLKVQDAKFAAALPELHALTGAKVSSEKATAYAVKQTEAAIRAAALNFLHLAVEETVHACLTIGASLQTAKVMEWQKSKRITLEDMEKKTKGQIEQQIVEGWLRETLNESLPKKLTVLNALLPPTEDTGIDAKFVAALDEARHDAVHRGGLKEAATFGILTGHALAIDACAILIDRVLDYALPKGWRETEEAAAALAKSK